MKTPALPVDKHVLGILAMHAELAMHDAAHMELPGLDPLTLRAQLWEELIDFVALRAEDEEFALDFDRRRARRNAFVAGGDRAVAEALLYERSFDAAPADAPTARAFQVATYLQRTSADVDFYNWYVTEHQIEAMIRGWDTDCATVRGQLRMLADRFDLRYEQKPHGSQDTKCHATGKIGAITVSLWHLLPTAELEAASNPGPLPEPSPGLAARIANTLATAAGMQSIAPDGHWTITEGRIETSVYRADAAATRTEMRRIAGELGLTVGEKPHDGRYDIKIFASGSVNDIRVEFYDLAMQDTPETTDDGGALNGTNHDVAEEAAQRASTEREGQEELAAEAEREDQEATVLAAGEIFAGNVFDTDYELGCVATTDSDEQGNFDGLDSDGVECAFNLSMIVRFHPRSETDGMTIHDVMSAEEIFEYDQACEAAADYAASLEPGLEADL